MGHKIRTTITPGEVLEVDDVTLTDLSRQGLVHSSESGEHGKHKWKAEASASKADEQSGDAGKKESDDVPVTSTNLIQGPATVYVAPFGTADPATIATAPAAAWVDVGGTKGGLELNVSSEFATLTVDQIVDIIESRRTGREVTVKTTLAEATLANIANAIANAAPAANVLELDDGLAAFKPAYSAILIDGIAPGGFRRRIIVRKTLPTDAVGIGYKKDDQTVVPVTWKLHWVSTVIKALKIEDATS